MKLGPKIGFTDLWDPTVSNRQRFLIPALVGAGLGLFLIIADAVFSQFHTLGPLPHPPFPASIVASLAAGIGEEVLFRLFFISLWVWVISRLILKGRWQNRIFWIITGLSAIAFSLGHIPSAMIIFGLDSVSEIPPAILAEMLLLNGTVSVVAAYYFRKFGFLAPVGIHFWTDVVWHVIWGLV